MSSPQPQMVAQQMTPEAPARISSDQPRPVEPMSMESDASMRGGEGEKGVSPVPVYSILFMESCAIRSQCRFLTF
ncbi:hypothetical protein BBK36DRAFT_1128831 [Trichoderma citrinoviride]|uniref:Uncharacterized protein n=1 Tax=Trichoderma citrinoviride TaxID=58853 RepID=A0A2T4AZQ4_9HYPO|nr:hypothetical protein BBK36DRAFT_1128831 [Trichoderma citrinoviride]PTB62543.1 hypothetical protein BBK36DRAFT_1128831 [Trichoderma citrinoviride]